MVRHARSLRTKDGRTLGDKLNDSTHCNARFLWQSLQQDDTLLILKTAHALLKMVGGLLVYEFKQRPEHVHLLETFTEMKP